MQSLPTSWCIFSSKWSLVVCITVRCWINISFESITLLNKAVYLDALQAICHMAARVCSITLECQVPRHVDRQRAIAIPVTNPDDRKLPSLEMVAMSCTAYKTVISGFYSAPFPPCGVELNQYTPGGGQYVLVHAIGKKPALQQASYIPSSVVGSRLAVLLCTQDFELEWQAHSLIDWEDWKTEALKWRSIAECNML